MPRIGVSLQDPGRLACIAVLGLVIIDDVHGVAEVISLVLNTFGGAAPAHDALLAGYREFAKEVLHELGRVRFAAAGEARDP